MAPSDKREESPMKKTIAVLLSVACGFIALAARAENIAYLSTTGDDGTGIVNNQSLPFKTITAAIAALGADGGEFRELRD